MRARLTGAGESWHFTCSAPAREVFAVMEQMLGMPPYRFEPLGPGEARIVEAQRLGFFGQWRTKFRRPGWVRVGAGAGAAGTDVVVTASRRPRNLLRAPLRGMPGPPARALQLVLVLTRGSRDDRTIYRDRRIAPGPVTLVASWAGMPYRLYTEPRHDAPRGRGVYTATRLIAIGDERGPFVSVELTDGTAGWVEADQIVPAPAEAVREAGAVTAAGSGPAQSRPNR
jgi:hypothetical protein